MQININLFLYKNATQKWIYGKVDIAVVFIVYKYSIMCHQLDQWELFLDSSLIARNCIEWFKEVTFIWV